MPGLTLRLATIDDAFLLLSWRNDPSTRRQSLSQDEITLEQHLEWLGRSLKNSARTIFIVQKENSLIGTIRVDSIDMHTVELSWTVASEFRAMGYGTKMLSLICQKYHQKTLVAKIRADNVASMSIARSCGFVQLSDNEGITHWQCSEKV